MASQAPPIVQTLTYRGALNAALHRALREFPEVLLFGEDVAEPGGIFGVTKGLRKEFGPRVFDTPISESAILGAALGAAIVGRRPIVEIMWADFLFVGIDQLVNQAASVRYLTRGGMRAPLTVRTQQGAFAASSVQHSRCVEAMLAHVPGLRIALPSGAVDAYSLLLAAIADDDPTVVIEHRALYNDTGDVAMDAPIEPIGGARIVRSGSDVTVVALSRMVGRALLAAEELASAGLSVEVVDPRWISPFDQATILESVARTKRLVVVHEAVRTAGFGAEIVARVAEHTAGVQVRRVTAPDIPKPSAPTLEDATIPESAEIATAIKQLMEVGTP
jgi:pyruvate/2-oxoglutarate/acetoin dehydrogenase E1 component